jgi:long-subunit fatty acid transport protein
MATIVAALLATGTAAPREARASGLLTGAIGGGDTALAGANVADPLTPSGAQYANPAGIASFETTTLTLGSGIAYGTGSVKASFPAGYYQTNPALAFVPDIGLVVRGHGKWFYSAGFHGTVGLKFDYDEQPSVGVDDGFFVEVTIFSAPLGLAYRASDRLWLGVELIPLFGYLRTSFTNPSVPELGGSAAEFRYKLTGPGIQAMAGLTWKPTDRWAIGLSGRPPGKIWMDGSSLLPGMPRQDVDLELRMPAHLFVGVTRRVTDDLKLSLAVRWIDSSSFGSSYVKFQNTPSADAPFLADAGDEWKYSLGAAYAWNEALELRAGVSHASHIIGNRGVSPAAFDADDTRFSVGFGLEGELWVLDCGVAYKLRDDRRVPASDALIFPGRYRSSQAVVALVSLTRRFL